MAASDDQVQKSKLVNYYLAKVLATLILHSYQDYALCFTFRFPLFHFRPIEWSEEHNVLFLREILARNVFGTKKDVPLVDWLGKRYSKV